MEFDPHHWFWRADDGRVFSSEGMAVVPENGEAFQAFLAEGGVPSRWPLDLDGEQTQAALDDVLVYYGVKTPDPSTAPMPDISDRQFAAGLWGDGIITYAECKAFVKSGDIPAALQAIIDTLPDDDTGEPTPRKEAEVLLAGAVTFVFTHPMVDFIRQAQGWTVEHLRERWAVWATL